MLTVPELGKALRVLFTFHKADWNANTIISIFDNLIMYALHMCQSIDLSIMPLLNVNYLHSNRYCKIYVIGGGTGGGKGALGPTPTPQFESGKAEPLHFRAVIAHMQTVCQLNSSQSLHLWLLKSPAQL